MLRRLYDWVLGQADKPHAIWVMGLISFAESSFFPLPPDVLLLPMMLADKRRCFRLATVATVTSVLGGFLGYAIGYFAFETIGRWIIKLVSGEGAFEFAQQQFGEWGFWLIVGKGVTPIPYKIVTIFCGFVHYDLLKFAIASLAARGMRFYAEAFAVYFGMSRPPIAAIVLVLSVLVVGGALIFQYVVGLVPCELCLLQRWPWYAAILLSGLVLALRKPMLARPAAAFFALLFLVSTGLAIYHVGIEQHLIPGPTACTAPNFTGMSIAERLAALRATPPVLCDQVQWSLFGVSLAGFNAMASLALLALCLVGWWRGGTLWRAA